MIVCLSLELRAVFYCIMEFI